MARTVRVFLSYRRDDSKHAAARIGERLDERFQLFMDVDAIRPGMDFTAVMTSAVGQSDAFVAVIGNGWLTASDAYGQRRLQDPSDFVATEIGTALQRRITIIPVLVDGARMPTRAELPPALAELSTRQALTVSHETFAADTARLVAAIESVTAGQLSERVAAAHAQMRVLAAAGQWAALLAVDTEVAALDPRAADVDGLASRARAELGGPPRRSRSTRMLILVSVAAAVAVASLLLVNLANQPGRNAAGTSPSPSTSSTAPGGPVSTSASDAAFAELMTHVPERLRARCRSVQPDKTVPVEDLTAVVNCGLSSGEPNQVEYYAFSSAEGLAGAFRGFEVSPGGDCTSGQAKTDWALGEVRGVLSCYGTAGQDVNFVWTNEELLILGWTWSTTLDYAEDARLVADRHPRLT